MNTTATAAGSAHPASHAVSKEDSVYARVSRRIVPLIMLCYVCLLYTSDAADEFRTV